MLEWEALETAPGEYVELDRRRDHMREAVDRLARERDHGRVAPDLDPAHLFLSFQALAAHPIAFPQMTWFVTGRRPDDPRFVRERRAFLRRLGARLEAT